MDDEIFFSVSKKGGFIKIENHSDFNLVVKVKPIKPKIKYMECLIIFPHQYKLYDLVYVTLDLTELSFSLEQP